MLRNLITRKRPPKQLKNSWKTIKQVRNKLPRMSEKSTFMFNHNFYPKPKVDLEDSDINPRNQAKIIRLTTKI